MGPWTVALAAGVPALLALPTLGHKAATVLALALAVLMLIGSAFLLYRSDFGGLHGIVASTMLGLYFAALATGACAAAAQLGGAPDLVPWLVPGALLTLVAVQGLVTRHHLMRLTALGESGAWVRASLDLGRAMIRAGHETADDIQRLAARRWLLATALFNAPWVIKAMQLDVSLLLVLVAAGLVLAAAAFCVQFLVPLAARSMFVLHLERQRGVHFVHEEIETLNQLRRSYWLSRLLMRPADRAAPHEPSAPDGQRTPSRRRVRRH